LLAEFGAASSLAWFLVMLMLAQLLGDTAPLQEFLETAQSEADRFPVADAHS
jgi:hypothetical protein